MLMVKGEGDDDGDSPLSRQENGALSILVVIHRHLLLPLLQQKTIIG